MEYWNGYRLVRSEYDGHETIVVLPDAPNGALALKTEYWDAFPATEIELVKQGYHLCCIKNDNRWGTDGDLDRKAAFVRHVQSSYGLQDKCVPVGMSCGGLFAIKFAAKYPELVSCLYLDAPVLNYMSCPCGFGIGEPLSSTNDEILRALGMESVSQLLSYRDMPLDKLPILVQHRIPVVLVAGDSDRIVPYCENGQLLANAYDGTGIDLEVYLKPGCDHHPHGLEDPTPVIHFIRAHTEA